MAGDIVFIGHVDHGKSTLLGRILLDFDAVPADKLQRVHDACRRKGIEFEPAFLLDALREEQEQGISIDTTKFRLQFEEDSFSLVDVPGHLEFLKNMASGASDASLAVLVVDVNEGIRAQTERHLKVLSLLGINKVVVAVNKMDRVDFNQAKYETASQEARKLLESLSIQCVETIPVAALQGSNVSAPCDLLAWYCGQPLVSMLRAQASMIERNDHGTAVRMALQDVYKFGADRYFVGKVLTGTVCAGTEVFFSPSGKVSKIQRIVKADGSESPQAESGEAIAVTLEDPVFVERGEVLSRAGDLPVVDTEFHASIVWLSATPLDVSQQYLLKVGTNECSCTIASLGQTENLTGLRNGDVASVKISAARPVAFDTDGSPLSQFVLCTDFETVAAGRVDCEVRMPQRQLRAAVVPACDSDFVQRAEHEQVNGHKGAVLWLTGLSGAGKTTLACALERTLFAAGARCVVLDGDIMRKGVCADLGFSPQDRSENVRRIAQVARLFLDAGFITIVACISPYENDRREARAIVGDSSFLEVFVFCPLEVCAERDTKGLYHGQKKSKVSQLTGVDAPYQPPASPEARIDSSMETVEEGVGKLLDLLSRKSLIDIAASATATGGKYAKIP